MKWWNKRNRSKVKIRNKVKIKMWWSGLEVVLKSIRKIDETYGGEMNTMVNEEDDKNNDDKVVLEIDFKNKEKRDKTHNY